MMQFAGKKGFWALLILGVGLVAFVGWRYVNTFSTVTFEFNPRHGSVRLASTEHGDRHIDANQPIRLEKGEYTLSSFGENVESVSEIIHIDGAWDRRSIRFNFNRTYLNERYQEERPAIIESITTRYPRLDELYALSGDALYGRGEYFGAALTFRDQTSDQRDRLHILLEKKEESWQVISNPPAPVLSKQEYPQVPRDILVAINQAR